MAILSQPQLRPVLATAMGRLAGRVQLLIADLKHSNDPEKLHELRVSLRRLGTMIALHRKYLDKTRAARRRKQIKTLAAFSNPTREAQVELALLRALGEGKWGSLEARLSQTSDAELAKLRTVWLPKLSDFNRALIADVAAGRLFASCGKNYLIVQREIIKKQGKRLESSLSKIHSQKQRRRIHQARVKIKEMRYLLDLYQIKKSQKFRKKLTQLQTCLGEVHDNQVFQEHLSQLKLTPADATALARLRAILKRQEKQDFKQFRQQFEQVKLAHSIHQLRRQLKAHAA